jgi:hypothetical protein
VPRASRWRGPAPALWASGWRCAVAALLVLGAAADGGALTLGERAPLADAKMKNVDGREIAIADVVGPRGVLVLFTCNACPWVRAWEERIVALGNTYRTREIGIIAVNANDPGVVAADGFDEMRARARERGFEFPYVVDATSDVARAFGATRTPEAFLFDATGVLVYHGAIDDNAEDAGKVEAHYLRDALDAVAGGRPVAVKETKALGCTIKFRKLRKARKAREPDEPHDVDSSHNPHASHAAGEIPKPRDPAAARSGS